MELYSTVRTHINGTTVVVGVSCLHLVVQHGGVFLFNLAVALVAVTQMGTEAVILARTTVVLFFSCPGV